MNAGYVRLSRDDDGKNYVSIENQKLIISQYAAEKGITIDRWYEDDGISGYVFDRPGFSRLMADLEQDVDTVLVKDFSRLGRHNAKVLLLLDNFQERGRRLIVIDDNYDSWDPDDDTIGIKTWFNERYVKDVSRKIRRAVGARQRDGTLRTSPPFGYRRGDGDASALEIVPAEAECVRMIYDLYVGGFGYRKIADCLTARKVPTPSMARYVRELEEGRTTKRSVAQAWTDGMVRELLDNDFYIGTLRLKKRARSTVHGKDRRVPKEEQYVFENHHPGIIDRDTYLLAQDIRVKRKEGHYRGSRGPESGGPSLFGSVLFCRDCKSRLTPIRRRTNGRERRYYICTTYNTKGRRYCSRAHLIEENDLAGDVLTLIGTCRDALREEIAAYVPAELRSEKEAAREQRRMLRAEIAGHRDRLRALVALKAKDLAADSGNEDLICETYREVQKDLTDRIGRLELRLENLEKSASAAPDVQGEQESALNVVDRIIAQGALERRDIELLIERIEVDENGMPEITLKYGLFGLEGCNPADEWNREENTVIAAVLRLIGEDRRGYTSAKHLSEGLAEMGFRRTGRSVLPYIALMEELGVLEATGNSRKPYRIRKTDGLLHSAGVSRRYAGDGIRVYSQGERDRSGE